MEDTTKRARRTFSEEFKREAAELAIKVGNGNASKDLGVNETQIKQWRMKFNSAAKTPGKKSYEELEKENKRLSKELYYMKEINDVLKKSTAIFSRDHMGDMK